MQRKQRSSRRSLLRTTGKLLPMLAALGLMTASVMPAHADDCGGTCEAGCKGTCEGGCKGTCEGSSKF
jgi:modification target Cys-rich repeat protein